MPNSPLKEAKLNMLDKCLISFRSTDEWVATNAIRLRIAA